MKKLIIALIAILGLFNTDTAQAAGKRYVTVTAVHSGGTWSTHPAVTVPSGKYVQIVSLFKSQAYSVKLLCTIGGNEFDLVFSSSSQPAGSIGGSDSEIVIAGPATIEFYMGSDQQKMLMTYEILPTLPE